MRFSQFTVVFQRGNKTCLFKTTTSGIVLLPASTYASLSRRSLSGLTLPQRLKLVREAMLVPSPEQEAQEYYLRYMKEKQNHPLWILTITPTYACNLSCTHCVQYDFDKSQRITDETTVSVLNFARHLLGDKATAGIWAWFYGGEPFMCPRHGAKIIDGLRQICAEWNVRSYFAVTTNGTLVTRKASRPMVEGMNYFYTGMAQSREAQARERPYTDGRNSYEAVLKGLALAAQLGKQIKVRFNVSEPEKIPRDMPVVLNDILRAFGGELYGRIAFTFKVLRPPDIDRASIQVQEEMSHKHHILETIVRDAQKDSPWPSKHFSRPGKHVFLRTAFPVTPGAGGCGFELCCEYVRGNRFAIRPDGRLQMCHVRENDPGLLFGNVSDPERALSHGRYLRVVNFSPYADPVCRDCAYLPMCLSKCPLGIIDQDAPTLRTEGCRQECNNTVNRYINDVLQERGADASLLVSTATEADMVQDDC
jgi:uncharacterized protein